MYEIKNSVVKRKKTSDYAQIHNQPLQTLENLEATGLLGFAMSLPDTWTLRKKHLYDKYTRRKVETGWKELTQKGYITGFDGYYFSKEKNKTLRDSFYMISDLPFTNEELTEFVGEIKQIMEQNGDRLIRVKNIKDSTMKIDAEFCNVQNVQYGETQAGQGKVSNVHSVPYGPYRTERTTNKEIEKKETDKKEIEEEEGAAAIINFLVDKNHKENDAKKYAARVKKLGLTGFNNDQILESIRLTNLDTKNMYIADFYSWAAGKLEKVLNAPAINPDQEQEPQQRKKTGSSSELIRVEMVPKYIKDPEPQEETQPLEEISPERQAKLDKMLEEMKRQRTIKD